jgi:tRNA modification GTPase
MEELASAIRRLAIVPDAEGAPSAAISHAHQKASLEKAAESLRRAADGLCDDQGMTPEIIALEIREALDFIGEITGRTSNDDILNHIFSRFCIGK